MGKRGGQRGLKGARGQGERVALGQGERVALGQWGVKKKKKQRE